MILKYNIQCFSLKIYWNDLPFKNNANIYPNIAPRQPWKLRKEKTLTSSPNYSDSNDMPEYSRWELFSHIN